MSAGSGPTSTTTARPGPVARTSPSPWPTSQTTKDHPGIGQVSTRVGTAAPMPRTAIPTGSSGRRRAWCPSHGPGHDEADGQQRQEYGTEPGARPGNRGERGLGGGPSHPGDGQRRQGRQPGDPAGDGGRGDRHQRGRHAEHGGRGDERGRKEVRDDADHGHRALQQHDDRSAHELRGDRDREGRSPAADPRRQHPTHRRAPRSGEQQQPERRQRRQREAGGPGQPRDPTPAGRAPPPRAPGCRLGGARC